LEYTKIPDWFRKEYNAKFLIKEIKIAEIEKDITTWAYFMIGIKLRVYQSWCIYNILSAKNKRIALCWARQLGKSIALGVFSFWATFYNKYPATVEKITTCYIMSRDDDTAKELLLKIRGLIKLGDRTVNQMKKVKKYFSMHYGKPDNQHQITWKNGSFIKSVPPTDTVIGKSASIFMVDEASKLKVLAPYTDKKLFYEIVEPTTSETNGFLIMSSTPNGATGLFYDLFDPDEIHETHEFKRIWFDYSVNREKEYLDFVENKKRNMETRGELKLWQQEYAAMFTVTQSSFFEVDDIMNGIEANLSKKYEWKESDCSLGVDYGMNPSRTVITVKTAIDGKITTINQIRFAADFDENNLMDESFENSFQNLRKRYKIRWVVADDCPQGVTTNNWLKTKGFPVQLFNFRSDQMTADGRNRGFYKYRTALKAKKIKYPNIRELIEEMKILEEIQLTVNVSVKAPRGRLCDCIDSEMMASMPFLEESGGFSSYVTKPVEKEKKETYRRKDQEWADLQVELDNSEMRKLLKEELENGKSKI